MLSIDASYLLLARLITLRLADLACYETCVEVFSPSIYENVSGELLQYSMGWRGRVDATLALVTSAAVRRYEYKEGTMMSPHST